MAFFCIRMTVEQDFVISLHRKLNFLRKILTTTQF